MKKFFIFVILCILVFITSLYAAVPNMSCIINVVATDTCRCGDFAKVCINGEYTNEALRSMGISSVHISGPTYYNLELESCPPHDGSGNGEATVIQYAICEVSTDNNGEISVRISHRFEKNTTLCSNHNGI